MPQRESLPHTGGTDIASQRTHLNKFGYEQEARGYGNIETGDVCVKTRGALSDSRFDEEACVDTKDRMPLAQIFRAFGKPIRNDPLETGK